MANVHIPTQMRQLCGGQELVKIPGKTVRELIEELEHRFPGVKNYLLDGNDLRPSIAVWVDGELAPAGLLETVGPESEVHFMPAIGGG